MSHDLEKRTAQYVQLRDKIKKLEEEHKQSIKPYKEALEKLEGIMMQALDDTKSTSIKTNAGTFFKSIVGAASVADKTEFQRFVIGGSHWELLDWKANKTAVQGLVDETGSPPPGVNYTTRVNINVRRAGASADTE